MSVMVRTPSSSALNKLTMMPVFCTPVAVFLSTTCTLSKQGTATPLHSRSSSPEALQRCALTNPIRYFKRTDLTVCRDRAPLRMLVTEAV